MLTNEDNYFVDTFDFCLPTTLRITDISSSTYVTCVNNLFWWVGMVTDVQPSRFASALGNCQGFCQGKSISSLMCISKFLLTRNCPSNIHVNFSINYCKKKILISILYPFMTKLIQLQLSTIKGEKWRKNWKRCDKWIKPWLE